MSGGARNWACLSWIALATALAWPSCVPGARAEIVRIEVLERADEPAGEGVGAYARWRGRLHGELDPAAAEVASIQDIGLAPRNARGRVEYVADFELEFPLDPGRASGTLLFDVVNRGLPLTEAALAMPGRDGRAASFFRERGFIVLRVGWQADAPREPVRFGGTQRPRFVLDAPIARGADGAPLTGPVRVEIVPAAAAATLPLDGAFTRGHRPYPPLALDAPGDTLSVRARAGDPRVAVARADWAFADCSDRPFPGVPRADRLCLRGGFRDDRLYELVYVARDPLVLGIGLAAVRDATLFFRDSPATGGPADNPVAGQVRRSIAIGVSQAGNFLRTLVHLGFNRDARGRRVFDGVMPLVASRATPVNLRFGQPGRAGGAQEDHDAPGYEAPLTWSTEHDAVSGRRGGLLARCARDGSCPKVVQVYSSTEYWQLRASLTHTDARARRDLALPPNVRTYYVAGTQHMAAPAATPGSCVNPRNDAARAPVERALLVALERWVAGGRAPPASVLPALRRGELVTPDALRWPAIPGVAPPAAANDFAPLDFGAQFIAADLAGMASIEPPRVGAGAYGVRVPQVDADGNELGGLRLPALAAPLATHTGWNLRRVGVAPGGPCGLDGSMLPFARSRAERLARGDPRRSLEERYGDDAGYRRAAERAVRRLERRGFLLPADAARLVEQARGVAILPAAQR